MNTCLCPLHYFYWCFVVFNVHVFCLKFILHLSFLNILLLRGVSYKHIFLISFSYCSLIVNGYATELCVLILYSTILYIFFYSNDIFFLSVESLWFCTYKIMSSTERDENSICELFYFKMIFIRRLMIILLCIFMLFFFFS